MKKNFFKRFFSILLSVVMLVGVCTPISVTAVAEEEEEEEEEIYGYDPNYEHGYYLGGRGDWEGGTWIREVYDWDDMDQVFQKLDSGSMFNYGYVTVKLMADLDMSAEGLANNATDMKHYQTGTYVNIVFDFNGHTLSGTDNVSTTNLEYSLQDFIAIYVGPLSQLTFEDSVGGGGISFYSHRAHDKNLAALHVYGGFGESEITGESAPYTSKVIFNGGKYELTAKMEKFGTGTLYIDTYYRGTVIADMIETEINDGTFIANSEGLISSYENRDMCARELAAFGTAFTQQNNYYGEELFAYGKAMGYEDPLMQSHVVINGGYFKSAGYALHHFENSYWISLNGDYEDSLVVSLDDTYYMDYPRINGGIFVGQIGYTGITFTYSDGNEKYNDLPASMIISEDAELSFKKENGDYVFDVSKLDWDDLHDMQSCIIVSGESAGFSSLPETDGEYTHLTRNVKQSDTFEVKYREASWFKSAGVECKPAINVTKKYSSSNPKTYYTDSLTLNYEDYPNGVEVKCLLFVDYSGSTFAIVLENNYDVDVLDIYNVEDLCMNSHVSNRNGDYTVVEGMNYSFSISPDQYYELTDPDKLEVYVNSVLVTPDEDGVYTVQNVTEDLVISCDGSAFTGYSNLKLSANGKFKTEKVYVDDIYTFKTLEDFGATVPEGSTFSGWKMGGKLYQPGDTYTVKGTTDIKVEAVFTGLYNITVENGTAYADEEHTQPISVAAEDQVIYVVADEAPEGKVFCYWSHQEVATPGGSGWFGNYDSAETTYTVYYSDVVLAPVYETLVDNVTINGVTEPKAGVVLKETENSWYNWGESVPENAGYTFNYAYWYDITTGEAVSMSDGDVFQLGHTYRYDARLNVWRDYTFPENAEDLSVTLTGISPEDYELTAEYSSSGYVKVIAEFTCDEEVESGVSVNGTAESFGGEEDVLFIDFILAGSTEKSYSAILAGTKGDFVVENVEPGTYTMRVTKNNHVTREYEIVVADEDVVQDVKIHLLGDINGDGRVNTLDVARANAQAKGVSVLSKYEFDCVDVNGDGKVNTIDVARINAHAKGVSSLW